MTAVIRTILGGGGTTLALGALIALLAAALLPLAPAAADGDPDQFELALSLVEDSDNIVPAGSELTVKADLRFPWQPPITPPVGLPSYTAYSLDVPGASAAASRLRISGDLEWDSAGRLRLDIAAHTPLLSQLPTVAGADRPMAKALDGRTLVARDRAAKLYVFDSYTLQHQATINPPPGADTGLHNGFGASVAYNNNIGGFSGSAVALWHETDARAWLFVGSYHDTVESTDQLGRLYIFRLDWGDDEVTVTQEGALAPTLAEANNRHGTVSARYGAAVAISRDGGTLAVSAMTMNEMGAIYVYSRPDGAGEDWGDITYADGVKVTAAAVPSFGTSTSDMPFLPGTAYDASNPRSCDAWCSRVWSNIASAGNYDGVDLGAAFVSLSADGRVLAAGAPEKDFASTTAGGGFTNANQRDNAGEVFVWVAPEGGWSSAPRADRDADGNAKTLIAAQTDATNFRQATHYSPGPLRRWTEPAAILTPEEWPNRGPGYFGLTVTVSPDGAVVVADDIRAPGSIYLFQRNSADGWAALSGGYLTASAAFANLGAFTFGTRVFNYDSSVLAVGDPAHSGNRGSVLVFSRPADGTWVNAGAADAARQLERAGARSAGAYYGYMVPELQGRRVVIASQAGRNYLTAPAVAGCTVSTVNGVRSASCPLTLPDATITIPDGTPDGPFSIVGSVAVQLGSGDPVTLRDTLEVTIGEVDELAQVEFDFDTNVATGRPQPAAVEPGGSTTLLLKLLNENGKASAKGAASSVLFTVTRGSLSARLGAASGEACATSGEQSCRIANPTTALTASNTDQIRLTLTHPGAAKAGATQVRAVVVGATGQTFETEPITVTFSGPPAALAISQPPRALLGHQTSSTADLRHGVALVVSATDAAGNKASVPHGRYSAKLTGPDGKEVAIMGRGLQVRVQWPLSKDGGIGVDADDLALSDGNPQVHVWVLANKATPLATGEYTLELSAGSGANKLTATQTLSIAGGAAEVALSADPVGEIELDDSVTLTATVTDASGAPVPDGTPVRFAERSTAANVTLVLLSQSEQRTRDGQASATLRAVGVGGAYVTAEADDVSGAQSITVAAPPPSPPDPIAALTIGSLSTWIGASTTTAAVLYAVLEGVSRVSKWDGEEWVGYSETGGRASSGSVDFAIRRGDILWLDGE